MQWRLKQLIAKKAAWWQGATNHQPPVIKRPLDTVIMADRVSNFSLDIIEYFGLDQTVIEFEMCRRTTKTRITTTTTTTTHDRHLRPVRQPLVSNVDAFFSPSSLPFFYLSLLLLTFNLSQLIIIWFDRMKLVRTSAFSQTSFFFFILFPYNKYWPPPPPPPMVSIIIIIFTLISLKFLVYNAHQIPSVPINDRLCTAATNCTPYHY